MTWRGNKSDRKESESLVEQNLEWRQPRVFLAATTDGTEGAVLPSRQEKGGREGTRSQQNSRGIGGW